VSTAPPLRFGPYRAPPFAYGDVAFCEMRGEVVIVGLTAGPIPWPVGKRGRAKAPVVYAGLAEAVRREESQAVAAAWGVTNQTVTKWRRALGVRPVTEGTSAARADAAAANAAFAAARGEALARMRDPQADAGRRRRIAAARRGKPRPPGVMDATHDANRGRTPTDASRARMSASHRARGTRPPKAGRPWTAAEDALVGTLKPAEAAARTGRTLAAVYGRRAVLGVPDGRVGRGG
jgi:hypothetical protein